MKAPRVGARVTFVNGPAYFFGYVIAYRDMHDGRRESYESKLGLVMRAHRHGARASFQSVVNAAVGNVAQEFVCDEGVYWCRGWSRRAALAMLAAMALR